MVAVFQEFALSFALGMLIGLEREYSQREDEAFAGVRTFALVSVLGTLAAVLSSDLPWMLPAAFLTFGGLVVVGYWVSAAHVEHAGTTTEVASLVVFLLGAAVHLIPAPAVVAIGVGVLIVLSAKETLHRLAERIERQDIVATLKFAVVTFIILPVLPKKAYTFGLPFDVFNPHKTWLMVILISGISFVGYVLVKVVGARKGIGLTGAIGGLVSSTAVTLSFSRKSGERPELSAYFSLAVLSASAIMFVRVLVEIAVVNRALVKYAALPMCAMAVATLGYCAYLYLKPHEEQVESVSFSNPFELLSAVKFAGVYALIVFLVRAAEHYIPSNAGVYLVSVLSGLTDVDAITLSVCEAAKVGAAHGLNEFTGPLAITLAVISNTCAKGAFAFGLGSRELRRHVAVAFGIAFVAGAAGVGALFFLR